MAKKKNQRRPVPRQKASPAPTGADDGLIPWATPSNDVRRGEILTDHRMKAFNITPPAPPPPSKRSKFWRQYQNTTTGGFIGWLEVIKLTKNQVISRLRLRKPNE